MSDHETQLRQQLARTTGLSVALLQQEGVVSFIRQRCEQWGLRELRDYVQLLTQQVEELDLLVRQVAVAETWLFRYPASYELLREDLRGRLQNASAATCLRMLSVACATGEEAYSMAITAAAAGWPWSRIVVDAVDRQAQSLAIARRGIYTHRPHRESPPPWALAWLHSSEGTCQIDCRVMAAVNLVVGDVLNESFSPPARWYDVVFCRNLLIYLNPTAREQLADRLAGWLRPDGILFVGHAESTPALRSRFTPVAFPHAFAMRPVLSDSAPSRPMPVVTVRSGDGSARGETDPPRDSLAGSSRVVATERTGQQRGRSSAKSRPGQDMPKTTATAHAQTKREAPVATDGESRVEAERSKLQQAKLQADHGELHRALATLQSIPNSNPADPRVYELFGNIYLGLQQLDQARAAFERLVYLSPDHTEALLHLALISERAGDIQQAVRYRQRAARSRDGERKE